MQVIDLDPILLSNLKGKTAVVTGAAGGIGAEIVRLFSKHGVNVVLADLEYGRLVAEGIIALLTEQSKALFVPANTLDWTQMKHRFKESIGTFSRLDIVVTNAGLMESKPTLDIETLDDNGELHEATEASKAINVNVKGL